MGAERDDIETQENDIVYEDRQRVRRGTMYSTRQDRDNSHEGRLVHFAPRHTIGRRWSPIVSCECLGRFHCDF